MEDNSSASSDSDNALLSPKSHSRIGCNAATQTPEMPRHEIRIPDGGKTIAAPETNGKAPIMVYKLDTQKPISELEKEAKNLSIPDVVVEYIKDSYHRQDNNLNGELGVTNPAFEPQDLIIVRTSSSISLRDDVNEENAFALSPIGKGDQRMYYSLPRSAKKCPEDNSNVHTQLPTPNLLSAADPSLSVSSSSLGYPRSVPPSPNFGYRPLESETSAVYTIIAPVRYVGNATEKENELRILAELQAQMEKEKALARKFEFMPAPVEVERKRHRLQCMTDTCSTLFLIPGIFIAIVTPISLIPMFLLPLTYYIPLILIFILSGCAAVVSLTLSGLTGNVVWHYDAEKKRLRPRIHCGRGPLLHFWGNGFYPLKEDKQPLQGDKVV